MHDMSKETFLRPDQLKRGVEIELTQRPEWGTAFIRGRVRGKPQLWEISKSMDKRGRFVYEDELLQHWRTPNMSNTRKEIAARLGFAAGNNAKASFGRAEDVYRLLETTPGSYANYKKRDALVTEAMRLADITPAGKDVSLHELAEMVGQDLEADRSRMSRPGAKDEFAGFGGLGNWTVGFTDVIKERIAQLKQLAKSLKATVTLGRVSPNGMYSGTVTRKYGPMEPPDFTASTKVKQLIKSLGGYENDSWRYNARPGAKDAFAETEPMNQFKVGQTVKVKVATGVVEGTIVKRLYDSMTGGERYLVEMPSQTQRGKMEQTAVFPYQIRASRPGAKASFAWKNYIVELKSRRTGNKINFPNSAIDEKSAKNNAEALYGDAWEVLSVKIANSRPGAKTRMTREQTEEQKAGLKLMSAADPAVGAKIATLIKEGKPQDQAVAIALDMKRRGEL